jgi:hypothetical protein
LRHERDPRRTADQQHRAQVGRAQAGGADSAAQRHDRLLQRGPDHRLELGADQPGLGTQLGQQDRDGRLGVAGQRFLGLHALAAQPGHRAEHVRVLGVQRVELTAEAVPDVAEHDLVEVDPAEALDAFRLAEQLECAVVVLAHHGGVEGAATEVVDRDGAARVDPLGGGVADRGGLRLGQERDGQADVAQRPAEQVLLVRAPARRVGHRDPPGRAALALTDQVDDPADHARAELVGLEGAAGDHQRDLVADPALELADHPVRIGQRTPLGRFTDQHRAVVGQVHHRRDGRRPCAQGDHIGAAGRPLVGPTDRGRGVGGAQIDAELVGHRAFPLPRGRCRESPTSRGIEPARRWYRGRYAASTVVGSGE